MKARNPISGNFEEVYVKALDSMPVGTQIEYTGSTIPVGWEEVNDYSTTEIDTGKKWIDGKPIYRKVINFTSGSSVNTWASVSSDNNIKEIMNYSGYIEYDNSQHFPLPYVLLGSSERAMWFEVDKTTNSVKEAHVGTGLNSKQVYLILEYIKTTD